MSDCYDLLTSAVELAGHDAGSKHLECLMFAEPGLQLVLHRSVTPHYEPTSLPLQYDHLLVTRLTVGLQVVRLDIV